MNLRLLLVFPALLALPVVAFAQTAPGVRRSSPPEPPRNAAPAANVNTPPNDAPGPGVARAAPAEATEAEPAAAPLRELKFAEADADADRKISLSEFSNYVGNRAANASVDPLGAEVIERFRKLDQNGDAALTESEASTPAAEPALAPSLPPRRRP